MATKIALATGVGLDWLTGEEGRVQAPTTPLGTPYTREEYERKTRDRLSRALLPPEKLDLDGDAASQIAEACWEVVRILRAAHENQSFALAKSLLSRKLSDLKAELRLGGMPEEPSVEKLDRYLFGEQGNPKSACSLYSDNPEQVDSNLRLLSPIARLKWADALDGRHPDRRRFVAEVQAMRELIKTSFADVPPNELAAKPLVRRSKRRVAATSRRLGSGR